MTTQEIVFEYIRTQIEMAYDKTRRGKKGAMTRIEKLGKKLVEQGLLTEEQEKTLRNY